MSNPHEFAPAAVYALLALRQPCPLDELAVAARTGAFPSAALPAPKQQFAFTSPTPPRTLTVDGASGLRRSIADPFLVRLSAPELQAPGARHVDAA